MHQLLFSIVVNASRWQGAFSLYDDREGPLHTQPNHMMKLRCYDAKLPSSRRFVHNFATLPWNLAQNDIVLLRHQVCIINARHLQDIEAQQMLDV